MTWKVQLSWVFLRVLPHTSLFRSETSIFVLSFPSSSAHVCVCPLLSRFLCSLTRRWTVQSEAEIQGYQRGAGPCPQWSEQLVRLLSDPRTSSFAVAHLNWSTLFLLFSLICPKSTIKLWAYSTFLSFFIRLVYLTIQKRLTHFRNVFALFL